MFSIFSSKIIEKDSCISCIPNIEVEFELKGFHTVSVIEQQNILIFFELNIFITKIVEKL
jgi:hypothetical protein